MTDSLELEEHEHIEVELEPLSDNEIIPPDWEGDAYVKWDGDSRLLRIQETRPDDSSVAVRYFTIEGGFPVDWYDDRLVDALADEMGRRMMPILQFV